MNMSTTTNSGNFDGTTWNLITNVAGSISDPTVDYTLTIEDAQDDILIMAGADDARDIVNETGDTIIDSGLSSWWIRRALLIANMAQTAAVAAA